MEGVNRGSRPRRGFSISLHRGSDDVAGWRLLESFQPTNASDAGAFDSKFGE
jgi:hypothetical protein